MSCLQVRAKLSCQAVFLLARCISSGRKCSGCSRRTFRGTSAGPRTTAACPLPFRPPPAGHVEEPAAHDGVGVDFAASCRAAAGLDFNECSGRGGWDGCSSCVSGRAMASPGRHHPGRCKQTPCGSSWCWRCSCRARSQSCCQSGRPCDRHRLTGGQQTAQWRPARPARRTRRMPDQLTRKIAC